MHKQARKCTAGRKLKVSSKEKKSYIISQTVFSQLKSNHGVRNLFEWSGTSSDGRSLHVSEHIPELRKQMGGVIQEPVNSVVDTLGDEGTDHDAPVPGQGADSGVQVSGLDGSGDGGQERLWVDLDGGTVLHDAVVSDEDGLGVVGDDGVDLGGDLSSVQLEGEGLGGHVSLGGESSGDGGDTSSGLGDQGSVGDLNLLGDLVGGDGDSEDGGEAGDGEDGSDDDGGLHGLDRPLNVGQLSLEAGHGASSLRFHSDSLLLLVTSVFEFVFVKVRERKRNE